MCDIFHFAVLKYKGAKNRYIQRSMKVTESIYNEMLHTLPTDYETGGIIGGTDGTVTCAAFDAVRRSESPCCYIPNVELFNSHIAAWQETGTEFYGLFHSHLGKLELLSNADMQYAEEILRALSGVVTSLYFPIVIPNKRVISFVGSICDGRLVVAEDAIELVCDE